ncbi:MAG: helix-hairpin-helix domain-containing protein [Flavobacteriaceae bacterium]|nr:helix-hairpin-helix domain-containing protein [Flavobacteriaceae bacterium]
MKFLKSHFWYNKRQRNGILFLILIILILQIIYVFADFTHETELEADGPEIELLQTHIDSLKSLKAAHSKPKIYPFNPNYISDFKGYQLGMNVNEIDRLLAFRKTGAFVNTAKEFQNVTGINDSLLQVIAPYFKFPDWVNSENKTLGQSDQKNRTNGQKKALKHIVLKDLNTATAAELQSINGIGEKLSGRIVAYRKLLKGFTFNEQLYEVYYLEKAVADRVLQQFTVMQRPDIQQINVNTATFKELLQLPYIDYELTKKICDFRDQTGGLKKLEDLIEIDSFPIEKFDRIALYLSAE